MMTTTLPLGTLCTSVQIIYENYFRRFYLFNFRLDQELTNVGTPGEG